MAKPFKSFYRVHKRVQWTGLVLDSKTGELVKQPSMAKQEFKAECDINNILKQYSVTGMVRHISARASQGAYQDLPDPIDFQESLNLVEQARQAFQSLPSKVRDRFGQDPGRFLEFCSDPANAKELVELGLAVAPPAPAPTPPSDLEPPAPPPNA